MSEGVFLSDPLLLLSIFLMVPRCRMLSGFPPFVGEPQVEGVMQFSSEFSLGEDTKVCLP